MAEQKKDFYWIKSAILTIMQSLSGVLLGFGSFYLLVRLLSNGDFGAWGLFTATTTIVEFIRNGMVQSALIKFLAAADEDERPKIISASFAISAILTIIIIIINVGLANFLAHLWKVPEFVKMLLWYNLVFVFSGFLTQFQSIEQAGLKFKGIFVSTLIRQGGLFVYILAARLLGFKLQLIDLVYVQIVSTFISAIVSYAYVRHLLNIAWSWQKAWMLKLYHYGKYAFGTTISAMLSNSLDQMMLGGMLSAAAAGAYNVAVRITTLVEIPTSSIATIVFPQSSKKMAEEGNAGVKYLYEKSVGAVLAVLVPGLIFLFLFANYVVDFIAGKTYEDSIPVLRITVLYCLLIPYGRQFGTIINAIGKPRLTFYIVLITGSSNAILNYLLIKRYGVMGAAWATLASNIIGFVIGQILLKRELNINLFSPWGICFWLLPEDV
jgi:lipopolysaccharide exporter